jgi:hypothetical protein
MEAAVGKEFRWLTSFPVSENEIRRWAIAIYYPELPPRQYWDINYCKAEGREGIVAPEDFNPFAWATEVPTLDVGVRAERPWPEPEMGIADPETRAYILADLSVRYSGIPIRPGDVIRSVTRLAEYSEREGRLGLMLYTTLEDRWTNQNNENLRDYRSVLMRSR